MRGRPQGPVPWHRASRAWALGALLLAWVVVPQFPARAGHWSTVAVDSAGDVGLWTSLALDAGKPRISFFDQGNLDLKFASCEADCGQAANWTRVAVDTAGHVGRDTSLALDAGKPRISYRDFTNLDLKFASCEAGCTVAANWTTVAVDTVGDVGQYTSVAIDAGRPRISYFDVTNGNLKYAACDASCTVAANWTTVAVDTAGEVGRLLSLAIDAGRPRISYHDVTNGNLKYAACNASCTVAANWTTVAVDTGGNVGQFTSLAVDAGKPRISYYDSTNADLKYAACDASCTVAANWTTVAVDTVGQVGQFTSLELFADKPRIAYQNFVTQQLKFAACDASCTLAASWKTIGVDLPGTGGVDPSLALDAGKPRISHYDSLNDDLRVATCEAGCLELNPAPSITSAIDSPDEVVAGGEVDFAVGWTDPDPGELARALICKSDAVVAGVCSGGAWAMGVFAGTSPASAFYQTTRLDGGAHAYFAFVCDVGAACSGSLAGSFTVVLEPPPGIPSDLCQNGGGQEIIDTGVGTGHVRLHTWQESQTRVHVCVRAEVDQGVGGRLTLDGSGTLVDVSDASMDPPCTVHLLDDPAFGLWHSSLGQTPVSVCVLLKTTGHQLRFTFDPAGSPPNPSVTWTPDPGTPGLP